MSDGPSMPYTSVPPFFGVPWARAARGAASVPAAPTAVVRMKSRRLTPGPSIRNMRPIFSASMRPSLSIVLSLAGARVERLAPAVPPEIVTQCADDADDAHDGDGQEHEREREEDVERAHDQVIEQALAVAGHEPEEQGTEARGHGGHDADEERDPPTPDQAAQDVPPLLVRPQEVPGRAGRRESVDLHGLERIPRADERRGSGRAAGDGDDHEAGDGLAVPDERAQERGEAPGTAPRTRPGPLHRQDGRHRAEPTRAGPAGRGTDSAGRPRG